ncbi:MAG: type I-E CRISPR-associated protein Cas7/Cse4/CasC [Desulfovermiculus sp.]
MHRFLQLHILTSYPPANLNRDDLGRPKTAMLGGSNRLRISSQCLKRTWRTSDVFQDTLSGGLGIRSKEMGKFIYCSLTTGKKLSEVIQTTTGSPVAGISLESLDNKAKEKAKKLAGIFGKLKSLPSKREDKEKDPFRDLEIEQLAHFGPQEINSLEQAIADLADVEDPDVKDIELLHKQLGAADIAMFGRMLASDPAFNVDAAVQVSHAVSVQKVSIEEDYFTAVDDLNRKDEDAGAAHIGVNEFASGVFYLYLCVDRNLLQTNLGGDSGVAGKSLQALTQAALTVAPGGKQNSYASRAYASYALAEKGNKQPRTLVTSFIDPITSGDMMGKAISKLQETRDKMDSAYGPCAESEYILDVHNRSGHVKELIQFVSE